MNLPFYFLFQISNISLLILVYFWAELNCVFLLHVHRFTSSPVFGEGVMVGWDDKAHGGRQKSLDRQRALSFILGVLRSPLPVWNQPSALIRPGNDLGLRLRNTFWVTRWPILCCGDTPDGATANRPTVYSNRAKERLHHSRVLHQPRFLSWEPAV